MPKHPKNKAERRLIDHKKKKKGPVMRDIIISEDNVNAAIESFLYSMRLCNADEKVVSFCPLEDGTIGISLKTVQEDKENENETLSLRLPLSRKESIRAY